jgi:hypothetical protein
MTSKEQLGELRELVPDVDFAAIDEAYKDDFDLRTDVNRRAKATRAQLEALAVPGDPRQQRVDEVALVAELERAGELRADVERVLAQRQSIGNSIERQKEVAGLRLKERDRILDQIDELQRRAEALLEQATAATANAEKIESEFTAMPEPPTPPDTAALVARIDAARKTNADVKERERALEQRAQLEQTIAGLVKQSQAFTDSIDKREQDKAAAVAAAELPIEGLGFGADEILFNGLPFDQASDAEKLRVSVAIAAAKNPKLRVVRIREGSLLDADGVKELAALAAKYDLQVWREVVVDGAKTGIVIEDGRLVGVGSPA